MQGLQARTLPSEQACTSRLCSLHCQALRSEALRPPMLVEQAELDCLRHFANCRPPRALQVAPMPDSVENEPFNAMTSCAERVVASLPSCACQTCASNHLAASTQPCSGPQPNYRKPCPVHHRVGMITALAFVPKGKARQAPLQDEPSDTELQELKAAVQPADLAVTEEERAAADGSSEEDMQHDGSAEDGIDGREEDDAEAAVRSALRLCHACARIPTLPSCG